MSILVFGSLNMDLVVRANRLPVPGETVVGQEFSTVPGGKGANQAVAAAKLAIATRMVGRVGNDGFGRDLLTSLHAAGVETAGILIDESAQTGVAAIAVEQGGENQIIIIPGANGQVDETDAARVIPWIAGATTLLLQCEVPMEAVLAAARAARQTNTLVVIDPAPVPANFPAELYELANIITPNETEASQLVGFPVDDVERAERAASILRQRGVETAIIKLGGQGAVCASSAETFHQPAFAVDAVDTVAAGDAFNAALAVALTKECSLREAVRWGAAAGALSAAKLGAQTALPNWQELHAFLQS